MAKKYVCFLLVTTTLVAIPATAQGGWIKNYGDGDTEFGEVVEETSEGGYYVLGTTYSAETKIDIWILKTDKNGDTVWTRTYGGSLDDWGFSGQITSDGGFIITGFTESFGAGKHDAWLLKIDPDGDTAWTQTYGDTGYDVASSVHQTTDDGYIITGHRDGKFNQDYNYVIPGDIWLIKTQADGTLMWEKTYGTPDQDYEEGLCVRQTSDGGYIVGCYGLYEAATLSYGRLMRTDASGDSVWVYRTAQIRWFNSVLETSDGDFFIAGNFNPADVGVAKIDATGNLLWEKSYGDPGTINDWANGLAETPDGNYIVTGLFGATFPGGNPVGGDVWLLKVDDNGDTLWTRLFGDNPEFDAGRCVKPTSDGGYIIAGYSGTYSNGNYDICLIKTDEYGMVAVAEEPVVDVETDWHILSSIGRQIVLRYEDRPEGFHAQVFDASGRMVDEIHAAGVSGSISWPVTSITRKGFGSGVYFIKVNTNQTPRTCKVILVD
jgi:hypothetical protein